MAKLYSRHTCKVGGKFKRTHDLVNEEGFLIRVTGYNTDGA